MEEFKKYIRRNEAEIKPYIKGEDLSQICVYGLDDRKRSKES